MEAVSPNQCTKRSTSPNLVTQFVEHFRYDSHKMYNMYHQGKYNIPSSMHLKRRYETKDRTKIAHTGYENEMGILTEQSAHSGLPSYHWSLCCWEETDRHVRPVSAWKWSSLRSSYMCSHTHGYRQAPTQARSHIPLAAEGKRKNRGFFTKMITQNS